jgi:hypothetical protein
VMISVGGATYPFPDNYNADGAAALVFDLGANGIDIDWENNEKRALFGKYIAETRRALGENYSVSTASFSVGAYGEGIYANEPPYSDYRGMNLDGLKSNGHQLDWINIMTYDASDAFSPTKAYEAHRSYYKGPLLIGGEVPPESWGGHILDLTKVKAYSEYVKKDTSCLNGIFVWSWNKQGFPSCDQILSTAIETFNDKNDQTTVISPVYSELIGKNVLGNIIIQDSKSDWAKIDGVVVGDNFPYQSYKSTDISSLLDTVYQDQNVVALLYNWKSGEAYAKTGVDFNNSSDTKINTEYTSFIVKSRVNNSTSPVPVPVSVSNSFVTWNGNNFMCNNQKFVPVGVNCFGLGLCQEYMNYFSHKQITEIFDSVKKMSATCIRSHTLGFSASSENSLLDYNLNFRERAWDPIDFSLSEARRTGIKVIPILSDPYEYYHASVSVFCTNGVPKEQFYTHPIPRANFKKFISEWLNHTNKYTKIINKDCSDIFSVQIGNELGQNRPSAGSTAIPTSEWLNDISNFIKSIAPNILILCPTDETLGQSNEFNIQNLDVYSQHFYWNDFDRMNKNFNNAKNVKKPYIIGEYSSKFGQDWFSYIENLGINGSCAWSLYPHEINGNRVPHNDGFTFWYDNQTSENTYQLLLLTNHFRRMKGEKIVNQLTF